MSLDKFDPRAYEQFIRIDSHGGNIGTLNWTNKIGSYTLEAWYSNCRLKLKSTEHFGCFRFTKGLAIYDPVTIDFSSHS
jgi:hypothetical protein